jgi:hypothetical protein
MSGLHMRDLDGPLTETRMPKGKGWRPSRRQIRFATVASLVVAMGLGLLARAVATPPTLRFTNVAVFPVDPAHAEAVHTIENRLGREVEINFVPGGRFTVLLDLTNEGRRRVRVLDLPETGDLEQPRFSPRAREREERRPGYVDERIRPFTLDPGESVTVRYTFVFSETIPNPGVGCMWSPDQSREAEVTYKKLGFHRTRSMPFREAYLSMFPSPRCDENLNPVPPS